MLMNLLKEKLPKMLYANSVLQFLGGTTNYNKVSLLWSPHSAVHRNNAPALGIPAL